MMRRILWWAVLGLAVMLGLTLLVLAARIALYRQRDDRERVEAKRAYLERIAERGGRPGAPNLVLILFDDLGLGDIGAYGGEAIRTPRLDRLAAEGLLFRQAYAPSPYCSASRAGLLTGRYAVRSGMDHVLQPRGTFSNWLLRIGGRNLRLPGEEITLAEVLAAAGYDTALVGKWHLGARSPSLPNDMGFDSFYGLLFSNDQGKPVVWRDREVVEEHPIDQTTLTRRYTERAVAFIEGKRDRPFFLYMPHTFPHIPLHASEARRGHSPAGLFGDVVEELDESVGRIIDALESAGLTESTLVVVSSDNGPWFQGSPGALRGRKFHVFEGGMRVPLIAWGPGLVEGARVSDEPVVGVDLFPTVLELLGLPLPEDRVIDGRSLLPLLRGGVPTRTVPVYYHQIDALRAVREGRFKYHDRHRVSFGNPMNWIWAPWSNRGPWLFDLALDRAESYDASERHPEIAARLRGLLEQRQRELEENPRGWR